MPFLDITDSWDSPPHSLITDGDADAQEADLPALLPGADASSDALLQWPGACETSTVPMPHTDALRGSALRSSSGLQGSSPSLLSLAGFASPLLALPGTPDMAAPKLLFPVGFAELQADRSGSPVPGTCLTGPWPNSISQQRRQSSTGSSDSAGSPSTWSAETQVTLGLVSQRLKASSELWWRAASFV